MLRMTQSGVFKSSPKRYTTADFDFSALSQYNSLTKNRQVTEMETISARISSKYPVVLPKAVRDALRLRPQDQLMFLIDGNTVIIRPQPESFTEAMRGLHQGIWPDPDIWLEEERQWE